MDQKQWSNAKTCSEKEKTHDIGTDKQNYKAGNEFIQSEK